MPLVQKIEKFQSLRALVAGIISTFICVFSLYYSHMCSLDPLNNLRGCFARLRLALGGWWFAKAPGSDVIHPRACIWVVAGLSVGLGAAAVLRHTMPHPSSAGAWRALKTD